MFVHRSFSEARGLCLHALGLLLGLGRRHHAETAEHDEALPEHDCAVLIALPVEAKAQWHE